VPTRLLEVAIVLACLAPAARGAEARKFEHPGGLHSREEIRTARAKIAAGAQSWKKAYQALVKQAGRGLERKPAPIANFNVPGYYGNPKGHRERSKRLHTDVWAAYSCALAYQLTAGNQRSRYADKAVQVLAAWAKVNTRTSGGDGTLVMAYGGVGLVFAAELLSDYRGWSASQRADFKKWVRGVYLKACTSIAGRGNNWGDWGVLGCTASHHFLDDAKGLDADIARIRKKIDASIAADGRMPAETGRGKNGIWYTYFALAPLTAACQVARNGRGVDLFHYKGKDGAGIERALDYLLRYCKAPKKWPHYRGKDLNLPDPRHWPGNLFQAMAGIYGKKQYADWPDRSRPIMLFGHHYAWSVPTLLRTLPAGKGARKD
jgi:hypothetical protein